MTYVFDRHYNRPGAHDQFIQYESFLTDDEIEQIKTIGNGLVFRPQTLYGPHSKADVDAWKTNFPLSEETRWVYERMAEMCQRLNANSYRYDITGFGEDFYFLRYVGPDEHFGWHVDMTGRTPTPRKLTAVLQLSDPSEYEGGEFDVQTPNSFVRAEKKKGIITLFPAWKIHRVTQVTSGTRLALAMFLTGPNLK